jgi:hypothetical protein
LLFFPQGTKCLISFFFYSYSPADIKETLGAMRGHAPEALEALSAFSRVYKGHSALTSECGSLIEEVWTI